MSSLLDVLQKKVDSFQNCQAWVYCNGQGDFCLATTLCEKICIITQEIFTCYSISQVTLKNFLNTPEKVQTLEGLINVEQILNKQGNGIKIIGVTEDLRKIFLSS